MTAISLALSGGWAPKYLTPGMMITTSGGAWALSHRERNNMNIPKDRPLSGISSVATPPSLLLYCKDHSCTSYTSVLRDQFWFIFHEMFLSNVLGAPVSWENVLLDQNSSQIRPAMEISVEICCKISWNSMGSWKAYCANHSFHELGPSLLNDYYYLCRVFLSMWFDGLVALTAFKVLFHSKLFLHDGSFDFVRIDISSHVQGLKDAKWTS